jgi:alkylated DNA repair dioxygenase AlkB
VEVERHGGTMRSSRPGGDLFDGDAALPEGLVYRPELISEEEERALLREVAALPLHEAQYKEYTARRRIVSYGSSYDFSANVLNAEAPIPAFLLPLRERIAAWVQMPPARFGQALVTEYRPGTSLGWHRDVPQFGIIVGVSLGTACRMRFRPYPHVAHRRSEVFALDLAPRSAYVLRGDIRWRWQHSIPPTPALRYSITFRTGVGPREGASGT